MPQNLANELIEVLIRGNEFKVERIVSKGHSTPTGEWYDQEMDEWVMVLKGSAGLRIEGKRKIRELGPGDYVHLSAHQKHRVEWTDENVETIWLAIYYKP